MELRGGRRANKPLCGLFSRHYYRSFSRKAQSLSNTWASSNVLWGKGGKKYVRGVAFGADN